MAKEQLDPYRKWLGIPPEDQPPHHYRLLGIENFEPDPDVITSATDGRMAQVKNFQVGEHSKISQKVLNEIAAARVCLLNADKKAQYDEQLKQKLAQEEALAKKIAPAAIPAVRRDKPTIASQAAEAVAGIEAANVFASVSQRGRKRGGWHIPVAVGLGLVAAVGIAAAIMALNRPGGDTQAQRTANPSVESEEDATPDIPAASSDQTNEDQPAEPPAEPPADDPLPKELPLDEPTEKSPTEQPAATERVGRTLADLVDPIESGRFLAVSLTQAQEEDPVAGNPGASPTNTGGKLQSPSKAERKEAEKGIREIYKKEFSEARTADGKLALAATLSAQAEKTADSPTARFVLLQLACNAAAEVGQLKETLKIVDRMDEHYQIDVPAVKAYYLSKVLGVRQAPAAAAATSAEAMDVALRLVNAAVAEDDYQVAERFATLAVSAARKTRDTALIRQATDRNREIDGLRRRYAAVAKALETLVETPDDADANLRVGKWYCFTKGDWDKGLPALVKSSDPLLSKLAQRDIEQPQTPKAQAELADDWWDIAKKQSTALRPSIQLRAGEWYEKALPSLPGLDKVRVQKRLEELAALTNSSVGKPRGAIRMGNVALAKNGAVVRPVGCDMTDPAKLNDGNAEYTNSNPGSSWPCDWVITLDQVYQLRHIRFRLYDKDGRFHRYVVAVSENDKGPFEMVVDRSKGEWVGWQTISFPPRPVKSIKLSGVFGSANTTFIVTELEAYCIQSAPSAGR